MSGAVPRDAALDAAEQLFYSRGIQTVGMDDVRHASGLSLKRLYQLFGTKEQLVGAYLERHSADWRARLARHVDRHSDPRERILAVFDWLHQWFGEPSFHGCAWTNAFGELGATSHVIATQARAHKSAFRAYLAGLVADAGQPEEITDHLQLLAEGAMVLAGISACQDPALQARQAALRLLTPTPI